MRINLGFAHIDDMKIVYAENTKNGLYLEGEHGEIIRFTKEETAEISNHLSR